MIFVSLIENKKGQCSVIPDRGLFLAEDATSDSGSFLLKGGAWAFGIILSLFRNTFFAITIFLFECIPHTLNQINKPVVAVKYVNGCSCWQLGTVSNSRSCQLLVVDVGCSRQLLTVAVCSCVQYTLAIKAKKLALSLQHLFCTECAQAC